MPFTSHRRDYATPRPCKNNCPDCKCRDANEVHLQETQAPLHQAVTNPFRVLSQKVVDLVTARQALALVEGGGR